LCPPSDRRHTLSRGGHAGDRRTQTVPTGADPRCTAGAPAQAPGERPTNKARRSKIGAARCDHHDRSLALLSRCSGEAPAQAPGEIEARPQAAGDIGKISGEPWESLSARPQAAKDIYSPGAGGGEFIIAAARLSGRPWMRVCGDGAGIGNGGWMEIPGRCGRWLEAEVVAWFGSRQAERRRGLFGLEGSGTG
jgi:hypothetical protein